MQTYKQEVLKDRFPFLNNTWWRQNEDLWEQLWTPLWR